MFAGAIPTVRHGKGDQGESGGSSAKPGFEWTQRALKPGKIETMRRCIGGLAAREGIERSGKGFASGIARTGILGEAAHDDTIEFRRDSGVEVGRRRWLH